MTVATTAIKATANGNGVAVDFSFSPIIISDASEMRGYVVDASGAETEVFQSGGGIQFEVHVSAYPGTGYCTYPRPTTPAAPLATGQKFVMRKQVPMTQNSDLQQQGGYNPETQESSLDKLTFAVQQLQEQLDRCFKVPFTDLTTGYGEIPRVANRIGMLLGFDAAGKPAAVVSSAAGGVYEEGTWTPTIVGDTTAGTQTYSHQSGEYTRIGNIVRYKGRVTLASKTGTGIAHVTGLPFSIVAVAGDGGTPGAIGGSTGLNLSAGYSESVFSTRLNSGGIGVFCVLEKGDNVTTQTLDMSALSGTASITFSGWTKVA